MQKILLALVGLIGLLTVPAPAATLIIVVTGGDGIGTINVGVCDGGTLSRSGCSESDEHPSAEHRILFEFDVPEGLYAVVAYEDANGNDKHDRFKERYAVSGCATSFGPARIVRAPGKVTLRLHGIFGGC